MSEELAIIVRIEEGINLNVNNNAVVALATLGGNVLESDSVEPGYSTLFDCDLMWQCDRTSIKRMKTENYPIKIEIYYLKDDDRHIVGHLILPIRNIPRLLPAKAMINKPKWYKLIGLSPEYRTQRPELFISAMITEKDIFLKTKTSIEFQGGDSEIGVNPAMNILTSQKGIFIRLLQEEGLLQIGNIDTDCDIFVAKINLHSIRNVQSLINDPIEDDKFALKYYFPPSESPYTCEMKMRFDGFYKLQEVIGIKVRSSLKTLQEFYNKIFFIPIELYYEDKLLGSSKLILQDLLKINDLDDFINCCHDNDDTYEIESSCLINSVIPVLNVSEIPQIEFTFTLTYVETKQLAVVELCERKKNIDYAAAGDSAAMYAATCDEVPPIEEDSRSIKSATTKPSSINIVNDQNLCLVKSTPEIYCILPESVVQLAPKTYFESSSPDEMFHTFTYTLLLQSIKFSNNNVEDGVWQVSFYHAKADKTFTILNLELHDVQNGSVDFGNLELKLYFSTTKDNIQDLVGSDLAIFNICGPHGTRGKAELNNKSLLAASEQGIILLENQQGENMAMATVSVKLDDLGVNHNSQFKKSIPETSSERPVRPFADDNLAYKFVEDLEKWKKSQEEDFLVELKRKEVQHLTKLTTEWKKRKSKLEKDLTDRIQKCQALTDSLEEAQMALKEKGIERLHHEQLMFKAKTELEECFNTKLLSTQAHSRQVELDFTQKLHEESLKFKTLEIQKVNLESENHKLKKEICEFEHTNHELKKSVFPREQLTVLLQDMKLLNEKYQNCRKSKMFYKEQWAKMIREVHLLRSEIIQKEKKLIVEKKHFTIDDWLDNEKFELESDMSEMEFIKKSFDCD